MGHKKEVQPSTGLLFCGYLQIEQELYQTNKHTKAQYWTKDEMEIWRKVAS